MKTTAWTLIATRTVGRKRRFDRWLVLGTFAAIAVAALPIGCGGQSAEHRTSGAAGRGADGSPPHADAGQIPPDGGLTTGGSGGMFGGATGGSGGYRCCADGSTRPTGGTGGTGGTSPDGAPFTGGTAGLGGRPGTPDGGLIRDGGPGWQGGSGDPVRDGTAIRDGGDGGFFPEGVPLGDGGDFTDGAADGAPLRELPRIAPPAPAAAPDDGFGDEYTDG
jgi:hypothetical protein